ncbi:flagellar hook-length control protein FliK [Quatrionicoccus australiensis]|uniref:flagellar hook-length control protein FliK n=1 Tax=Quatrionicoccus australiensis TaxID=138118 RepID=UPI001CF9A2BF|nr:flagellar hook-length control protein FliK [Quatrionicoccus australiensis]MCB4360880.1 flagellar hook-length control protein FliK [Quatrionicoccus australiensis]
MGITIISTSSTSTAASSPTLAASLPSDGLPAGFAALLSGQIGNAASLASTLSSGSAAKEEEAGTENKTTSDLIATDPALALFMAIPAQSIPATTNSLSPGASDTAAITGFGQEASNASGDKLAILSKEQEARANSPLQSQSAYQDDFAAALKLKAQTDQGTAANIAAETLAQAPASQDTSAVLAAGTAAAQQKQATQAQSVSTEVSTPLHADNWSNNFSEKIVWLAKNDQQTAQININPPQLGPVQITLQINGDQASAIFASPHAEVRQAIESSLSQLKEMLAGAGINLGQADVGANMAQQNREAPFQSANGNRSTGENAILPGIGNTVDSTVSTPVQRGRGMVDLFA